MDGTILPGPRLFRGAVWLAAAVAICLVARADNGPATPSCAAGPGGGCSGLVVPGPRSENVPVGTLVLVNSDGFGPVSAIHRQILGNLPPDVKAIVLVPASLEIVAAQYLDLFPGEFRSGRFARVRSESEGNWARDFLPEAVVETDGTVSLRQFSYYDRPKAEQAAQDLARALDLPLHKSEIYLEFGNLMFDGRGTAFATEFIIKFNQFLHQDLDRTQIEQKIKEHLGLDRIVWLPRQPMERSGHIDMFAKLVGEKKVLVADSRIAERREMLAGVARQFEARGYEVIRVMHAEIPSAPPQVYSYTNSTIVNGVAFVPVYFDPAQPAQTPEFAALDRRALEAYRRLGFQVVPIQSAALVAFGGSIHCLTRQLPRLGPRAQSPAPS